MQLANLTHRIFCFHIYLTTTTTTQSETQKRLYMFSLTVLRMAQDAKSTKAWKQVSITLEKTISPARHSLGGIYAVNAVQRMMETSREQISFLSVMVNERKFDTTIGTVSQLMKILLTRTLQRRHKECRRR